MLSPNAHAGSVAAMPGGRVKARSALLPTLLEYAAARGCCGRGPEEKRWGDAQGMRHLSVAELRPLLRTTAALLDEGFSERSVRAAAGAGRLHRVRTGVFMDAATWAELSPESRHRAEVVAAADASYGRFVAFGSSAAVLWNLPLYRFAPSRVHAVGERGTRGPSTGAVARHEAHLGPGDVTEVAGIPCTSLTRTTFDLVRSLGAEAALACADASLGRVAVRRRVQDPERAGLWAEDLARRISDSAGARGIRTARRVVALADGRAELPGESVSRLQLIRLGFERPRVQAPVPGPDGGTYWLDFALDDVGVFGEFDGKDKYLGEALRRGRTLEEVLLDEKRREDWVRGRTGRRVVRWGSEHIATAAVLGARLASFGVRPPRG